MCDQAPLAGYYEEVDDLLSETEFRARVDHRIEAFGGLLTEAVAAKLVLDELERLELQTTPLTAMRARAELGSGSEATSGDAAEDHADDAPAVVIARVLAIEPVHSFTRKSGERGEVANLSITDGTAECRLALWDEDQIAAVVDGTIKIGSYVRILQPKPKLGPFGFELSVGRWGTVAVISPEEAERSSAVLDEMDDFEPPATEFTPFDELPETEGESVHLSGTVLSRTQLRSFSRKNGTTGHVVNFELFDGTGRARITLWDRVAKDADAVEIGDTVALIGGITKHHRGMIEIHSRYNTKLKKQAT